MRAEPLDINAVQELSLDLLKCVRVHYERRTTSRATALEVLNATAIIAAVIFAAARAAGGEHEAREFFDLALEQQLEGEELPTTLGELMRWTR